MQYRELIDNYISNLMEKIRGWIVYDIEVSFDTLKSTAYCERDWSYCILFDILRLVNNTLGKTDLLLCFESVVVLEKHNTKWC